ncbi:FKBP-type peptidyl-prolyl cis-trans isomerase [Prolixibacteraceae bacterium Z1-6]|uniref:Peptidyl-prolyl cis-trans isomerase n=1 Tax=Draconibacterium aestuarii TaxID=2998507 RepID=A0A9X3F9M6_9BACT|nr:FKBP-type peptidyl-prolyl cis-trans isomerase [Prolixibacteraceae bacterium Z1-6]
MNLRFLTKLVFAALLMGFVVSCFNDDTDEYIPPTYEEEMALLSEYLDSLQSRGFDVDTTDMGVYYLIDSIGEGDFPVYGDTCSVKYTGFFLSGNIFDSSGDNTFDVVLGEEKVISGWEDGLQVFNTGSKGYLIIPSEFAYGSTGNWSIPPYTTLIFYIDMVEIKQGY